MNGKMTSVFFQAADDLNCVSCFLFLVWIIPTVVEPLPKTQHKQNVLWSNGEKSIDIQKNFTSVKCHENTQIWGGLDQKTLAGFSLFFLDE
jgi:hypothetical protein